MENRCSIQQSDSKLIVLIRAKLLKIDCIDRSVNSGPDLIYCAITVFFCHLIQFYTVLNLRIATLTHPAIVFHSFQELAYFPFYVIFPGQCLIQLSFKVACEKGLKTV